MGSRDVELDLIGRDHTGAATRSAANNLDQLKAKLGKFNVDTNRRATRDFLRTGIQAASAFSTGFLKTISAGFLGRRGNLGMAAKMSPGAAATGIVVGGLLASKVLSTAHAAILAGLPLILGAGIAAGPIVHLVKGEQEKLKTLQDKIKSAQQEAASAGLSKAEKERLKYLQQKGKLTESEQRRLKSLQQQAKAGKADADRLAGVISNAQGRVADSWLTKLSGKWKSFARVVSKPMKVPFLATVKEIGRGLDGLKKPFASLVKDIGPALKPFTKGVFDGVIGFVKALKPAMPGITAGFKEWGKQLPIIMTAFGDAFAEILKDPAKVQDAVRKIGDALVWVADSLPGFVDGIKGLSLALKGLIGPIGLVLPAITTMVRGAVTLFWTLAISGIRGITMLVAAMAVLNPAMRVPLAGLQALLAGAELTFAGIKNKWADTDAAVRKRIIVASITARIDDLETKIAAAKTKLKTVKDAKTRAKIEATIKDLEAKAAAAKRRLALVQGTRTVAKIKAEIKDLETKTAAAKARLKTVKDAKTQAKIKAEISDLQAKAAAARRELASIKGKSVTITATYTKIIQTINKASINSGNNKNMAAGDGGWLGAAGGGMYRSGGATVSVAAPIVDTRVFIDGSQIRSVARSTVVDENRRAAHRARVGRR